MSLIHAMASRSSARSLYLKDPRTLLLVGVSYREEEEGIVLEEVDISNYSQPIVRKSSPLGYGNTSYVYFLDISPQKTKYFLFTYENLTTGMLVFDCLKKTVTRNQESLIGKTFSLGFSQDGKNIITASNGQFVVVELLLEYPNSQIFDFSNNIIGSISLPKRCQEIKVSPDGKTMFIALENDTSAELSSHTFEIWNLTENPVKISSRPLAGRYEQMHFSPDYKTVYLLNHKGVYIFDVVNKSNPELLKSFYLNNSVQQLLGFQILSQEKTAIISILGYDGISVRFLNISSDGSEEIKPFGGLNKAFQVWNYKMVLKDDKTLIIVDNEISIYNISNFEATAGLISSLPLATNEPEPYISSCVLSPDNKTLFIETYDQNMFTKLSIYDISRLEAPKLITEQPFSKYNSLRDLQVHKPSLSLSPDATNGFVFQDETLVRVNLSNLKQPTISGIMRLTENKNKNNSINNYVLSSDSQLAYVIKDDTQINFIDTKVRYTLFLKQERFLLGQKYSDTVSILGLTNRSDYELMDKNASKIIRLSLLDLKVVPNQFELDVKSSILPSWIVFDNQNNMLTLEPKKQRDLGIYTFHSAFSLKIPIDTFDYLRGGEKNSTFSEDLLAWLISLDYIDSQLFLTRNFGSNQTFLLPAQFNPYKKEIYNILKKFYVETCTSIEIVPSLELKNLNEEGKNLMISTLSFNTLRVEIKLFGLNSQQGAQFLWRHYASVLPVITEEKTKIFLEGTLKEINEALGLLVVNFVENSGSYIANMTISDAFNPTLSVSLTDISKYFKVNKSPALSNNHNKTVQNQIDSTKALTGEYWIMTFDKDTFKDEYSESLNYEIAMAENGTEVPNWLTLGGLTLRGTPPEEIFGRNIDLVLIAKNEFKECREPFKLKVKISSVFMLKLILRYSPYVLTLVGLLVSANKIYNILGKRFYKHPKEYVLNPCEEIKEGIIFPIFFVKQEKEERDFILKRLVNKGGELGKQRISESIEEIVGKMSREEKKKLELYCSVKNSRKALIQQLVIDKMVLLQLNKDKKTKAIFEKIKDEWIDVIYWDISTSNFALDMAKFDKLLEEKGIISSSSSVLLSDTKESLLNESTIIPGINIALLKDSLLAYGFEQHQINKTPLGVEIHLKQKVPSNILWRFLKLDLTSIIIVGNKIKIDYGINYKVAQSMLSFEGMTSGELEGKTIVIQITNTEHKILKEIWVYGNSETLEIGGGSESSLRGKSYEVY